MERLQLTFTQLTLLVFAIFTCGYVSYLENQTELTPSETQIHKVMVNTHDAASRAILLPSLASSTKNKKKRKRDAKKREHGK